MIMKVMHLILVVMIGLFASSGQSTYTYDSDPQNPANWTISLSFEPSAHNSYLNYGPPPANLITQVTNYWAPSSFPPLDPRDNESNCSTALGWGVEDLESYCGGQWIYDFTWVGVGPAPSTVSVDVYSLASCYTYEDVALDFVYTSNSLGSGTVSYYLNDCYYQFSEGTAQRSVGIKNGVGKLRISPFAAISGSVQDTGVSAWTQVTVQLSSP